MINAVVFLSGIAVATFMASGVFFYKFYKISRDNFYLLFCLACWLLGIERVLILIFVGPITSNETTPWVYIIRLVAFLMIFFAIYNKNKSQRKI